MTAQKLSSVVYWFSVTSNDCLISFPCLVYLDVCLGHNLSDYLSTKLLK